MQEPQESWLKPHSDDHSDDTEVFEAPQVGPDLTVPGESYSQVVVGHSNDFS